MRWTLGGIGGLLGEQAVVALGVSRVFAVLVSIASLLFAVVAFTRTQRASVRPVLVFSVQGEGRWVLQNVGDGPAMNVFVGEQDWNERWSQVTQCHPIAVGGEVPLSWMSNPRQIAATYCDVDERDYTSWCRSHRTTITGCNEFPDWVPTDREYELRKLVEARSRHAG